MFTLASTRPSFTTFAGFLAASREMGIMDVLAMDDDVPKPVLAAVKAAGWSKVLDHQVCGFWFGPADEIPTQQPQWMPTGAVVPPQGAASRSGELAHCHLVLVPVDGWWHPLRYGAIWTWVATAGIARGETWRFVPEQEEGGRWGQATLRFDQFVYVSPAIAAQAFEMPDRFLRDDDVIVTLKEAGQTSS
ncbi:MAG: hypothetical protein HY904_22460 [Deltaproteobacteria bacterium]|nr:hypothetical protein [Deltaproteobacteria bacterium]